MKIVEPESVTIKHCPDIQVKKIKIGRKSKTIDHLVV